MDTDAISIYQLVISGSNVSLLPHDCIIITTIHLICRICAGVQYQSALSTKVPALNRCLSEFRSCVKVEVAVLDCPS